MCFLLGVIKGRLLRILFGLQAVRTCVSCSYIHTVLTHHYTTVVRRTAGVGVGALGGSITGRARLIRTYQLAVPKKLPAGTPPRGHSCWRLPFTAYGTFFCGTVELYQSNHGTAGNREAGDFGNSSVRDVTSLKSTHYMKK